MTKILNKLSDNLLWGNIISSLPCYVYWLDKNNVYLGCNDLQAKMAGLMSVSDIVGLTNYDLPCNKNDKSIADKLNAVNLEIMNSGKLQIVEEPANLPNGVRGTFLSFKQPMFNENKDIIGILGISLDITERKKLETKLADTEQMLENLISALPGHVYWQDLNNLFLGCNEQQAKTIGLCSRHDFVGRTVGEFQTKEDTDAILRFNNEVMKTGVSKIIEENAFRADGSRGVYLSHKVPLRNSQNNIIGLIGISFDITERKHLEAKLAATERMLNNVISLLPGHVYWVDRNHVILGCNEQQAKTVGLKSRHEVVGRKIEEFQTPENAEISIKINNEVMATGEQRVLEEPFQNADGSESIFLSHKVPLRDVSGDIIGVVGLSIDISERKRLEKELELAKKRAEIAFENVIAMMPGHVYWQDKNNVFLGCNDLQAISAGFQSRKEIIGKSHADMPWKDQAQDLNAINNEVMKTAVPHTIEEKMVLADGRQVIFLSKRVPLRNAQGEIMGVLGISFDITERKRAEEALKEAKEKAEAANRAKTDFLAVMSHELRTPLTAVIGLAQILSTKKNLTAYEREDYLRTIAEAGQTQLHLINDILDFATADAGRFKFESKPFNLYALIDDLSAEFSQQIKAKNLKLTVNNHFDSCDKVNGDRHRLHQVISNLVNNAIKFTERGQVIIRAESELSKQIDRIAIKITVEDTGPGIPEKKLSEIFDKFVQVRDPNKELYARKNSGVGLGLAISKTFIEQMGGSIAVDSKLGVGTKFVCRLTLPRFSAEADSPESLISPYNKNTIATRNAVFKILLVEDNAVNRKVIGSFLSDLNCEVDAVTNGIDALAALQKNIYDLVLMDVSLPDMSGLEVTRAFRRIENKDRHTPIIAVTAHAMVQDKLLCIEAGMDDYLEKPVSFDSLMKVIQQRMKVEMVVN